MWIILEIVAGWIALCCTLGPLLVWAFFYPERRAAAIQNRYDRWSGIPGTFATASDREKRKTRAQNMRVGFQVGP
jgi:hypothetical protein